MIDVASSEKRRRNAKRLEEWAQRDAEGQRFLRTLVDPDDCLQAVRPSPDVATGAVLAWNPTGTSRLRFAWPIPERAHRPFREGALHLYDTYLTLDDAPILQWRRSGCDTCEQLVRVVDARPEEVRRSTTMLRGLTMDEVRHDLSSSLPALSWLFTLLPTGLYLISLDDYFPIMGDDRCTWGCFHDLERCDALRSIYTTPEPRYLLPTQRLDAFRVDAWERAGERFRTHPGLALHVGGAASALLDGHHRALAAAARRERFSCITVTAAHVGFPFPKVGDRCDADPGPPEVHVRGVALAATEFPERLHPWLNARPRTSDRRWIWDAAVVDALEEALHVKSPTPDGIPHVDVEGVYPLWREQATRYDREDGEERLEPSTAGNASDKNA